jgi:poly-gamma-glutamate synthesis protein (capsule biosynthesis protein)
VLADPVSQSPPPPERKTIEIALTGDVLIHDSVWASARRLAARTQARGAFDFRPMLSPIRPIIAGADLALCHLETPLAPAGGPYSSYPVFAAPPAIAAAIKWTGYDGCTTASNHSVDQGNAGIVRTLDDLDRIGLAHTGTSRSRAEAHSPVVFDVDGIHVGWLSYTYGTNGLPVDADKPWSVNLIDPQRILRDAHRARAQGADAVLVALHWGDEYHHEPSAFQIDLARRLSRSPDITLIYGHHAHVTQPIRKVHGTWVVFGLGNLLADQGTVAEGVRDGMIALVTLTQKGAGPVRVAKVTSVPTHISRSAPPYGEIRVSQTHP